MNSSFSLRDRNPLKDCMSSKMVTSQKYPPYQEKSTWAGQQFLEVRFWGHLFGKDDGDAN